MDNLIGVFVMRKCHAGLVHVTHGSEKQCAQSARCVTPLPSSPLQPNSVALLHPQLLWL